MIYSKIILKSMFKRKLSCILVVLQLVISFLLIINSFKIINQVNYQAKSIEEYLKIDPSNTYRMVFSNCEETNEFVKRLNALEQYVIGLEGVKGYAFYDEIGIRFNELTGNKQYINRNLNIKKSMSRIEHPEISDVIFMNSSITSFGNIKIEEGRNLNKNDFDNKNGKPIPILIGWEYKDIIKIGEILTITDYKEGDEAREKINTQFIVTGVISRGSKWFSDNDFITDPLEKLGDKFIAPNYEFNKNDIMSTLSTLHKVFIPLEKSINTKSTLKDIRAKALEYELNVDFKSINELLEDYKDSYKEIIIVNLVLGIFLIIVSLTGIITVTINNINERRQEFGIRLMTGSSIHDIEVLIIGELMIITFIAFVISLIVIISNSDVFGDFLYVFRYNILLFMIFIVSLITIISSIYPIYIIRNLQPKELIGGKD